jgi:hypothetical protein
MISPIDDVAKLLLYHPDKFSWVAGERILPEHKTISAAV